MLKSDIRNLIKNNLAQMSETEKQRENGEICKQIKNILVKRIPETLVVYSPLPDEVNINSVVNEYISLGKNIFTITQDAEVDLVPIFPENSIILTPGRAFTKEGKRVGRGSGFYDKIISKNPHSFSLGVCFSCQILGELPEDNWDQRVDEVVFGGNILE